MQAVKEKLKDMSAMRKVKADAKAEEQAEKEVAKARMDVAHEIRLAKEAEAQMEMHVAKAGQKAQREMAKHASHPLNHSAPSPSPSPSDDDYHLPHPTSGALPSNRIL